MPKVIKSKIKIEVEIEISINPKFKIPFEERLKEIENQIQETITTELVLQETPGYKIDSIGMEASNDKYH